KSRCFRSDVLGNRFASSTFPISSTDPLCPPSPSTFRTRDPVTKQADGDVAAYSHRVTKQREGRAHSRRPE
ncbi:uncharacterized protein MYCGRDRAFT_106667, partial [Zymoseptoria tritici IPO323]